MIDEMIKQVAEQMANRRDEEILDALGRLGYSFKAKKELHQFCRNHCRVEKIGNESTLFVDDKPVSKWSEKVTTTFEGNRINITIG